MRLLRITLKDLRLLTRDRSALVFLLIVPMVIILVVAETQSGAGSQSILFPVVNEDQGPVASALIKVFREHLTVMETDRVTAERLVAVENKAPALLLLPAGMSKRYLTEKPSTIELLTDPAQWTELQAIKVIMLLADREASTLGDPFSEELLTKATTNPLLKDIIRRVQIDESRHAAFGILSMRQVVKESSPAELEEMEDFAFSILEALNANQQLDMLRLHGPKFGLDPDNVVQSMLAMPEWPALNSEIFMHTVMPNLKRLNLITERTEPEYRRIGMIYGDRFDAKHELPIAN